jgi:HK97 family phage major capsid protein
MPHIAAQLHARQNHHYRAARNLLAEKGASRWTQADQAAFDHHADEAERAADEINALSNHMDAFELYLRNGMTPLTPDERRRVKNTMSTTTSSQGGYTVAPLVAAELVNLLKGWGWMRQTSSQMTTDNGADMTVPTSDGTSEVGELLTQNTTATALDPSFGSAAIPMFRFSSKIFTVPLELLQDASVDIAGFILMRARDRIGRTQNTKFTVGSGTGEPNGLVTAASIGKTGTTGQTTTIIYDDLVDLSESVDQAQLGMPDKTSGAVPPGVGWMMSQAMRKVVRKLKDSNNRPIWMPGHSDGKTVAPAMLLDWPCWINNDVPTPAANAKSVAFGNLGSYMIRDALDVTVFRFDDSAFTKLGQVGFLAYARAGGNLLDSGAIKTYAHSST